MARKVFVGMWLDEDVRIDLKLACVKNKVNQADVMELLIVNWLKKPHVSND